MKGPVGEIESETVVTWFEEQDYPALAAMMADLPATWQEWRSAVEPGLQGYAKGLMKVVVKPGDFSMWCLACGIEKPGGPERARYAAEVAGPPRRVPYK